MLIKILILISLNFSAPSGCLQYYTTDTGTVESFNYRGIGKATPIVAPGQGTSISFPGQQVLPFSSPNYFNNMHYGICIHKNPRMCGIRWDAVRFDFGGVVADMSSSETADPGSARSGCLNHAVSTVDEDLGDYIIIDGGSRDGKRRLQNRFCGQRLNPDLADQPINAEIVCK